VMGSSTAYFLKSKAPLLKVAVIEKDSTYQNASSALSASGIRQQFSIPENVKLSQWSYKFMKHAGKHLQVPGDDHPCVQLAKSSYMFLTTEKGLPILSNNCLMQQGCNVGVRLYPAKQLQEKYPWLNVDDGIVAGSLCESGEGWFDGYSLLSLFRKKAQHLGVDYIAGECGDINVTSKVNSVKIKSKEESLQLDCSAFVNAAGYAAGELMQTIGIHLPVNPRKRYVFVFDCPKGPGRSMPFLVDTSGVYCRPEGRGTLYLSGCSPDCDEDEPCVSNLDVDYDIFYEKIWPHLANRVEAFEELKLRHSWSGYYDYNCFDQNAIIGAHPDIENLYFINGFSGHGIQQSPAVGNALSEVILDGKYTTIDLTLFGYERITSNEPVYEKNII